MELRDALASFDIGKARGSYGRAFCFLLSAFVQTFSKAVKALAGWLCIKSCGGNSIIVFVAAAFHVR
jgi:hypothetical protein